MLAAPDKGSNTIRPSNGYGNALLIESGADQARQGNKYLLRLINTSVDTIFVFAIDNHNITVMSSDFVPIQPYVTDHVTVGIGALRRSSHLVALLT